MGKGFFVNTVAKVRNKDISLREKNEMSVNESRAILPILCFLHISCVFYSASEILQSKLPGMEEANMQAGRCQSTSG